VAVVCSKLCFEKLKQLWRSDYVRMLEEEVSRLRAENRALMNSLLGTAGFPPVEFPEAPKPRPLPRLRKRSWHHIAGYVGLCAASGAPTNGFSSAPPQGAVAAKTAHGNAAHARFHNS